MTVSTCATTSGRVSAIIAIRRATSAWILGRRCCDSTWAASVVCRLETTSAIVCGDSLRRKTTICSAGVRRRNSNGRRSIVAARRPMISSARSSPSERIEHAAGVVDAALGEVVLGEHGSRRPR